MRLSLPKSRFVRIDGAARQGLDAQQCLRSARLQGRSSGRCHPQKVKASGGQRSGASGVGRAGTPPLHARLAALHESGSVQVFGRRQRRSNHALWRPASEKRQGTKSRRWGGAAAPPRALWGFGRGRELKRICEGIRLEGEYNLNVTARILLNGDFTFCPTYEFNDLTTAKERDRQLLRDELHGKLWTTA
jgi:hypothetical protein